MPPFVSISGEEKTGYLWRLSSRRLVYTPEWKRKYMVLSMSGYLYYYDSKTSQGGGRGSGVIDLRCVMDCVEAPLTDHKKATNVFILIAKQRGFFNQVGLELLEDDDNNCDYRDDITFQQKHFMT